jgi:hypothetical protein
MGNTERSYLGLTIMRASLHYTGHRFLADETESAAAIAATLADLHIVAACGSLAAGADILFAEFCLRARYKLYIWLPFSAAGFIAVSVRPAGIAWVERFERVLSQAASVCVLDGSSGQDPFAACSAVAMDASLRIAALEGATAVQAAVWNGQPSFGEAGTGADIAAWRARGLVSRVIPARSITPDGITL